MLCKISKIVKVTEQWIIYDCTNRVIVQNKVFYIYFDIQLEINKNTFIIEVYRRT